MHKHTHQKCQRSSIGWHGRVKMKWRRIQRWCRGWAKPAEHIQPRHVICNVRFYDQHTSLNVCDLWRCSGSLCVYDFLPCVRHTYECDGRRWRDKIASEVTTISIWKRKLQATNTHAPHTPPTGNKSERVTHASRQYGTKLGSSVMSK